MTGLFPAAIDRHAVAVDDGRTRITFGELERNVAAWVRLLREELGLAPGDHVAAHLRNRAEYVELVLAAIAGGLWITPVNWHLTPDEIAYVLDDAGVRCVFVDAETGGADPRFVDLDALRGRLSRTPPALDLGAEPGGTMIYTSGTSGRPKGVKRAKAKTLGAALEAMRAGGVRFGLDGRGPHLITGPMYHAAPLLFAIYDLLNGAEVLVMRRWDTHEALRLLAERRVRHVHLVPTMMARLHRLPREVREAFDPSALELVLHGAAPIAPSLKRAMIAWWGPVLVEYWGATEGGIYTLVTSEEWLPREGTVGRPIPSFRVFAVGEDGRRLGPNEIGTLYCEHVSEARPFVYHRDPAKTDASYLAPGVFTAFDLGHVDEEGYVYLSARRSNLILRGGVNVYPAEVERVLSAHPGVADVAVYGVPDDDLGERVHAAVETASGVEASADLAAAILDAASKHLARFKLPERITFVRRIPRTEAGKLRRDDLLRALEEERA